MIRKVCLLRDPGFVSGIRYVRRDGTAAQYLAKPTGFVSATVGGRRYCPLINTPLFAFYGPRDRLHINRHRCLGEAVSVKRVVQCGMGGGTGMGRRRGREGGMYRYDRVGYCDYGWVSLGMLGPRLDHTRHVFSYPPWVAWLMLLSRFT